MLNFKKLRKDFGLSQKGLAEKAGASLRTVQHWEIGDRSIDLDKIITITNNLGIPIIKFFKEYLIVDGENSAKIEDVDLHAMNEKVNYMYNFVSKLVAEKELEKLEKEINLRKKKI